MKLTSRLLIIGTIAFSLTRICTAEPFVPTHLSLRSQGAHRDRHLSGTAHLKHQYHWDEPWGTTSIALGYTRSFREDDLVECFFGSNAKKCGTGITISGSGVANRNATSDWLADYFYLPTDFQSSVTFDASISNAIADLGWYLSLDEWYPGLYIDIQVPIVRSRWNFSVCETVTNVGTADHTQGYFTPGVMTRDALLHSFSHYLSGNAPSPLVQTFQNSSGTGGLAFADGAGGVVAADETAIGYTTFFQPLRYAKIDCDSHTATRSADIRLFFGWNPCRTDRYNWGVSAIIAAPTGDRPKGEFLFEPVAGSGHHWELGAGLRSSWKVYESAQQSFSLTLHTDAYATHLFRSTQTRTLDLTGKPLSRYMLAQRLGSQLTFVGTNGTTRANKLRGNNILSATQFRQEFVPVANLTTTKVHVGSAAQGELTALLDVAYCGAHWSFGYNLWGRTCEKIRERCLSAIDTDPKKWALKGDARVYGFLTDNSPALGPPNPPANTPIIRQLTPIALAATQSKATIHTGLNQANTVNGAIDNPQLATEGEDAAAPTGPPVALNNLPAGGMQINTSIQQTFLDGNSIPDCLQGTSGLSSTFFTHLSYVWCESECFTPTIGCGGRAEFGHNRSSNCNTACECPRCSLSQWGVWFKGSLSF